MKIGLALAALVFVTSQVCLAQFTKIDNGTETKQVEATESTLYILKDSGNIWTYQDGGFTKIDNATGTKQVEATETTLYILKDNGNIWTYQGNGFSMIDKASGTKQLSASSGALFILKENGNVWRYDSSVSMLSKNQGVFTNTDGGLGVLVKRPLKMSTDGLH